MSRFLIGGVLVLFLSVLPSVLGAQDARETLFWQSVVCDREAEVRLYLEEYPSGAYVEEAWACLEGQLGLDRGGAHPGATGTDSLGLQGGGGGRAVRGRPTRVALRQWQTAEGFDATGVSDAGAG